MKLPNMSSFNYKISFCIVCMNRLHQLKETLNVNILDNYDYEPLEFVLLDYNSTDGLEEWIKENFDHHITTGRLVYYKTNKPQTWNPSHSKNVAFKLATGEIVCNIWADYIAGKGFAKYINEQFKQDSGIVLTPIDFFRTKKNYFPARDVFGKVAVKKADFLRINGFDERMDRHGFEDYDFVNRLEMAGVKRQLIEDFNFLKFLHHGDEERFNLDVSRLFRMYLMYISHSESELFLLYSDFSFDSGILVNNSRFDSDNYLFAYKKRSHHFPFSLTKSGWNYGSWEKAGDAFRLNYKNKKDVLVAEISRKEQDSADLKHEKGPIFHVADKKIINDIFLFKHYYSTRHIMELNLNNKVTIANTGYFGTDTVFKNFNYSVGINI